MQLTQEWDKTFPQSDKVQHQKVTFKNRYGITLVGDLYLPKEVTQASLPALAVSGPYGAVKEQASGLYAQTMAERGYITLAFDPSFTGESGGEPRHISSPEINTEDFSAAVDFLGLQELVDKDRIGVIGICGFGGMSLNAAAADTRIKAVVTTSMYDMSRVMSKGYFDSMTAEERQGALEQMNQQRWEDAKNGEPAFAPQGLPEPSALTGEEPPFVTEYVDYYRTSRGFHPRSINSNGSWTATTALSFMNMPLLSYIGDIAPRPLLLIAGENAHSRYFSEDASKAAGDNAELLILDGLVHVDLYDHPEHIPFARIDKFFSEHLA
ncbi:alpha/beta hydrolase [Photobacterium rosenbergii]|uniref:Alpha/beta hydrolase n=1 Tax=Photobacterium rosenbergii TaxID=294936 RepID=A0ABU3ZNF8_9GAMM|nr:alpha/beta hydrolase [Photobacterium rosenbergii]MDV5171591.1 alpha/beta hydrolase [Photobacterium rosenbergii]